MARFLTLASGATVLRVAPTGGALIDGSHGGRPFLRPYRGTPEGFAVANSASFPLVPFGNRIAGNAFRFGDRQYRVAPNTEWDPLHLHGDGWLAEWTVTEEAADRVALAFEHAAEPGAPFAYRAEQAIAVADGSVTLDLAVENRGGEPMPFGLGHHLFFPLTPETTLQAAAGSYWSEKAGFLPDAELPLPEELDFNRPRRPPRRWVNNGFEGWDGHAVIAWPEQGLQVAIEADASFGRYFVFVSDPGFEPTYRGDYFCFEPMTHAADAHNRPGLAGLKVLAPGERLATRITLTPTDRTS